MNTINMKPRDRRAIEILLRIGSTFGVSPISSLSHQGDNKVKVSFILFLLLLSSTMCVSSTYYNAKDNYVNMNKMDLFVDLLSMVFNGMLGVIIIIGSLCYSQTWKKLLVKLQSSRKLIQCWTHFFNSDKEEKVTVYTEIIVCHVIFIVRFAWDAYVWISCHGFNVYKNSIYRIYNEYCAMISILIMIHINLVIRSYFVLLNNTLRFTARETAQQLALIPIAFNKPQFYNEIRNIQNTYRKLSKMIEHFNTIFGYQILLLMGYTIVVTLGSLQGALKYNNFNEKIDVMVLSWSVISSTIIIVSAILL